MKRIPIKAGRAIAEAYGYDQVVIIARKVDTPAQPGGEHVTTYGVDKKHCDVAARIGHFFKHKLMGWPEPPPKVRCSECDNGVQDEWTYCPFCGAAGHTEKAAAQERKDAG